MKTQDVNGDYRKFLDAKAPDDMPTGLEVLESDLNPMLFPFQKAIVRWAIHRGRACIFADCGLGKTPMQLEWARLVPGRVLILAPLAVSRQTQREGDKFGIPVKVCRHQSDATEKINITNYEMLQHFDPREFTGIVLDESSILKSYTGHFRNTIIEAFCKTPFRLACTATPAPNDYMELGNHSEFVGAMTRSEMLSMFFVHDGGRTSKWRLKGHGEGPFWEWLCSWAVMIRKPSDLGFDDDGFILPPLRWEEHVLEVSEQRSGVLFDGGSPSMSERRAARRDSIDVRVARAAEIANQTDGQCLVWCDLNAESSALTRAIEGAVEVKGADKNEHKENSMLDFAAGKLRVMVTKAKISGFGMNFQSCATMVFVGLSDSYEALYQATRRCWRFGQTRPVDVHIVVSSAEGAVLENVKRKEIDAERMASQMVENMKDLSTEEVRGIEHCTAEYEEDVAEGDGWRMLLGDCVEHVRRFEESSIGYSIFSPPFASLYTYSNSIRDMGNSKNDDEFMGHFRFLVADLLRVTMPGRLCSFHCMNLPTSKARDGYIGMRDFRGELIRMFLDAGWIFHSEVCIWKDPVTSMQRTKALGLLWKQLKKDSCMSRQGIPDYIVTMRKPGENGAPVGHKPEDFPVSLWQKWASPVWDDINPSDTLQARSAREEKDERHICPLQLEVIRRCLTLWSRPGDLILSPFAGIGSEGYEAIKMDRKFVGIELKRAYWTQAWKNLTNAEREARQSGLFGDDEQSAEETENADHNPK